MRTIQKGAEPPTLTQHRQQPHADYDNYADKAALRQALVAEQRGLCCYCQSRIQATPVGMKIEHWQCQADHPERQLDYSNLLGACLGGHGRPDREQHCDTRKGNNGLCFSVCDPAHPIERKIRFLGDGTIKADDAAIDGALNVVLNLNLPRLVSNRKAVLAAFQQRLQDGRRVDPARELPKWDGTKAGDLPEFAQVVVYWLRKRQARATV
ncbi:retron system putative HNH endonuclease [Acidithiobacillus sp. IBUN Pt1247-S3]